MVRCRSPEISCLCLRAWTSSTAPVRQHVPGVMKEQTLGECAVVANSASDSCFHTLGHAESDTTPTWCMLRCVSVCVRKRESLWKVVKFYKISAVKNMHEEKIYILCTEKRIESCGIWKMYIKNEEQTQRFVFDRPPCFPHFKLLHASKFILKASVAHLNQKCSPYSQEIPLWATVFYVTQVFVPSGGVHQCVTSLSPLPLSLFFMRNVSLCVFLREMPEYIWVLKWAGITAE